MAAHRTCSLWVILFLLLTVYVVFSLYVFLSITLRVTDWQTPMKSITKGENRRAKQPNVHHLTRASSGVVKTCSPRTRVVFIKMPKCGSSTLASIFLRYGYRHNLRTALPSNKVCNLKPMLRDLNESRSRQKFDIFASHISYDSLAKHTHAIPTGAFYTTIIREPFSEFKSFFNYRRKGAGFGLRGKDQVKTFFSNPNLYLSSNNSGFYNRMIRYLGFIHRNATNATETKEAAMKYILKIDREFDFVMILEYFDECLILLKRKLCWDTHDILYTQQKAGIKYSANYKTVAKRADDAFDLKKHQEVSHIDYYLYDHFKYKLESLLKRQNEDFFNEVKHFRAVNAQVSLFCQNEADRKEYLEISPSRWGDGFTMHRSFCDIMAFACPKYMLVFKKPYFNPSFTNNKGVLLYGQTVRLSRSGDVHYNDSNREAFTRETYNVNDRVVTIMHTG